MEGAREIPLSRGFIALVDAADYPIVSAFSWTALVQRRYVTAFHHWREGGPGAWGAGRGISLGRFLLTPPPGVLVDHINGDALDNRRANLRTCTPLENSRNRRQNANATNPYKGVYPCGKHGWRARISFGGKIHGLGTYRTAEEAAAAYDAAALKWFGEFARLNLDPPKVLRAA